MSQYKTVECYKTFDGKLFENEEQAKAHADDILGEELDGLLKLANLDITRTQEYKALLAWMKDRENLTKTINQLYNILNFEDDSQG
ncbi:MAG: hypothetical protein M0R77_07770 [Gammaproteobacteria bacterium]|nr:hypothetical protein [Gammaproteobacteria bacterium]